METPDASVGRDDEWLFERAVEPEPAPWVRGPHPWRVGSQVYVAFFGGIVAVAAIAYLNARRLGMTAREQQLIIAAAVAAIVAVGVLVATVGSGPVGELSQSQFIRYSSRGVALVLYFVLARMQRARDRMFAIQFGDEYESLWVPGITAAVLGGLLQALLVLAFIG